MQIVVICLFALNFRIITFANTSHDISNQEKDKLYMRGDTFVKNEVDVTLIDFEKNSISQSINSKYDFEESLYIENPDHLFNLHARDIHLNWNRPKQLKIDRSLFLFIESFFNDIMSTYITREIPDLSNYYDLSSTIRNENKFLIEHFTFRQAIIKPNITKSIYTEILFNDIKPYNDVLLVELRAITTLNVNDSSEHEVMASNYYVYIANTKQGYKILKIWNQHTEFATMQTTIKSKVKPEQITKSDNSFVKYLIDEVNKDVAVVHVEDDTLSSISKINQKYEEETISRATDVSYDRTEVAKAAKKYATTYNSLFVDVSLDCTNYVSQCMWQSPNWTFDTIGNSDDYKWSCTKQTTGTNTGKYYRDIPVWAGVSNLFTYFQGNDNEAFAGTKHGISATTSNIKIADLQLGDVIQFFNGLIWRHSVIVSEITTQANQVQDSTKVKVAAHTNDYAARPLSEYLASGSGYTTYRLIRINKFIKS